MGLRSGLCTGQSSYYTLVSKNYFCMDLGLCTGALSCWNRKGPSPNCCHKVGSTEWCRMSLYAVVLGFPITGTKGPSLNHEKQPQKMFLLHQTLQLVLCIRASSVLLASAEPRFVCHTARWWSMIHHSRERFSTAPESNGIKFNTTPANAWHYTWWS
jgi:hypothetical protein